MSVNRLLILGVVRIFQPVHGYFVRRELMTWRAEEWAHINPGSIYNALRTLTREGFLAEVGTETQGGRPARTSYRLTTDGETEFLQLLRPMLWTLEPYAQTNLLAAWGFAYALSRDEVIAALEHRVEQVAAHRTSIEFAIDGMRRGSGPPELVAEHLRLTQARLDGEAAWSADLAARLRAGEYWFEGEPNPPWPTRDRVEEDGEPDPGQPR
ncbi:MAG: PadR family transcriptional regulator [Actinomycetota bacterium]|nr:PadR family transcriptional regulator [Actinomycetota bacterium]